MIRRDQVEGNQDDGSVTFYAESLAEKTIRETQALKSTTDTEVFTFDELVTLIAYAVSIAERDLY